MLTTTINLEFRLGEEFNQLYCPVCGKTIFEPGETFEDAKCAHVEWVYLDDICEFLCAHPSIMSKIESLSEKADDADDEDFDLFEEVEKDWSGKNKVIISITTGGMACGPVWSTVRVGLNFLPDSE